MSRPPLPPWFGTATTCLYAVCGLAAVALVGLFAVSLALPAGDPLPVIHVIYPHALFGEIWASARRVRTGRTGQAAAVLLLAGVVRVIAKELPSPSVSPAVS
ncbi:MAG: hypothetical protein ABIP45_03485 [Knoellia sp.]